MEVFGEETCRQFVISEMLRRNHYPVIPLLDELIKKALERCSGCSELEILYEKRVVDDDDHEQHSLYMKQKYKCFRARIMLDEEIKKIQKEEKEEIEHTGAMIDANHMFEEAEKANLVFFIEHVQS